MSDTLTDKTFKKYCLVVDEYYCNGFNKCQAYKKYYPNASDKTGTIECIRILNLPRIKEYEQEKYVDAQLKLDTSHQRVLQELKNWAYSDITETISLKPEEVKKLPIEIRRLITKYKHEKTTFKGVTKEYVELSFVSKEKAMDMINRHIGFYEKDNTQGKPDITNIINLGGGEKPD